MNSLLDVVSALVDDVNVCCGSPEYTQVVGSKSIPKEFPCSCIEVTTLTTGSFDLFLKGFGPEPHSDQAGKHHEGATLAFSFRYVDHYSMPLMRASTVVDLECRTRIAVQPAIIS